MRCPCWNRLGIFIYVFAALAGDGWRPVPIMVAVGCVATVANDCSLITING
nr:hypothetical protein SHINE37_80023 [Rhizobiaceae bacterium]